MSMSDHEFLEAFENCSLPAADWTHEAHVRMAWLYLRKLGEESGLGRIRLGIRRYNAQVLKKSLAYHETITIAYARLIAHRLTTLPIGHTFDDFRAVSSDLLDRKLSALLIHYRHETLLGDLARARFIQPDLEPLPGCLPQPSIGPPEEQDAAAHEFYHEHTQ
jgi:hypothetical protein